ncbi:uncharacterized protein V1516DRAFT_665946 [Lipomyces oligophaga]|uniref:uncharacterized protein n=1 Tax=Lipomyces oligophaga TaxID=45792 RepID=UPI0034D00A96
MSGLLIAFPIIIVLFVFIALALPVLNGVGGYKLKKSAQTRKPGQIDRDSGDNKDDGKNRILEFHLAKSTSSAIHRKLQLERDALDDEDDDASEIRARKPVARSEYV